MAAVKAPAGLSPGSKRLWVTVTKTYDLRVDELRVLEDACREADLIDRIEAELSSPDHKLVVHGSMGQPVSSPLVQEVRQHRATLKSLFASLKLPDDASSDAAGERSEGARKAAMARWSA